MSSHGDINECAQEIECESPAVHSYLNLLQSVINRMASNSASCKSWCITLVSAIIVILIDKDKSEYVFIAIVPVLLFSLMDCYYLSMEKSFRDKYNAFIRKLHSGCVEKKDLFVISPDNAINGSLILKSTKSISIYPFYIVFIALILSVGIVSSEEILSSIIHFLKTIIGGKNGT